MFSSKNNINNHQRALLINLPQRNLTFSGRQPALKTLNVLLKQHKFGIITQAITGLGGVGKTQLATEFAYQSAEKGDYQAVVWITAEDPNTMKNAYQEVARCLQLDVKELELSDMQTLVHNKLTELYHNDNVLFILDNVTDYAQISDYLEKAHKQLSPHLTLHTLITSRSQYWQQEPLMLDVFTQEEAYDFIHTHLSKEKPKNINLLAKKLHYFPLALSQAVMYIKQHTNIDDYLKLYAKKQKLYLDQFPNNSNVYNKTLWSTWNVAINKLSSTACELLFVSAYFEPDNVYFTLFNYMPREKRLNAIEELRKYSFIILVNDKSFKIHRLLQEVIRLSLQHNPKYNILASHKISKNNYWLTKAIILARHKFIFKLTLTV